jgi:hypothetical protein
MQALVLDPAGPVAGVKLDMLRIGWGNQPGIFSRLRSAGKTSRRGSDRRSNLDAFVPEEKKTLVGYFDPETRGAMEQGKPSASVHARMQPDTIRFWIF